MSETTARTGTKKAASAAFDAVRTEAPEAFRAFAEKGSAHAKEAYERVSAATAEASNFIQNTCSTAAKGVADYNTKVIEIARVNTNAAFDYARELAGVTSPSQF